MFKTTMKKSLPTLSLVAAIGVIYSQQDILVGHLPRYVLNLTPSIPTGIYKLDPDSKGQSFAVGDIVYFPVPKAHQSILYGRQYLALNAHLIKPVAAIERDHVCRDEGLVTVNHLAPAPVFRFDQFERPLPQITLCRALTENELFILSSYSDQSYDSRYFGPIDARDVIAKARLIVTFKQLGVLILVAVVAALMLPLRRAADIQ